MRKNYLQLIRAIATVLYFLASSVSAGEALSLLNDQAYDQAFRKAYVSLLKGPDGEASFVLGKIYGEGLGTTKKNQSLAMEYLSNAADADGNKEAVLYLASELSSGKLFQRDSSRALQYYNQAEARGWGDFSAQKLALLGNAQLNATVCQSLAKVINSSSSASELRRYGQCLADGIGVKKNTAKSKQILEQALAKNSVSAGIALLETFYLADLKDFQYTETESILNRIEDIKPSPNQAKKLAKVVDNVVEKLWTEAQLDETNTIFYMLASHPYMVELSKFTDPKTLDVTTLKASFSDCKYAFDNRVQKAATFFCEKVGSNQTNPQERAAAITLMAGNAEFFGGAAEQIEETLLALAREGDLAAIDSLISFIAEDEAKLISIAKRELSNPSIHESLNQRIQKELLSVFSTTLNQIKDGRPPNEEMLTLAFSIPHCPTIDQFIDLSSRNDLKTWLQNVDTGNLDITCKSYKNSKFPGALVKLRQVDYRGAMDLLKNACGDGSGKACVEMAEMYLLNKAPGVDAFSENARLGLYEEILERAVSLDEVEAKILLGGLLLESAGGEREERGLRILQQAYQQGAVDALYLIAADELKSCFFCSAKSCQKLASYITQADSQSMYLKKANELYKKKRCD